MAEEKVEELEAKLIIMEDQMDKRMDVIMATVNALANEMAHANNIQQLVEAMKDRSSGKRKNRSTAREPRN